MAVSTVSNCEEKKFLSMKRNVSVTVDTGRKFIFLPVAEIRQFLEQNCGFTNCKVLGIC